MRRVARYWKGAESHATYETAQAIFATQKKQHRALEPAPLSAQVLNEEVKTVQKKVTKGE